MDNRWHEEAGWDFELLGPELIDLQRLGFDLEVTGFDEEELARAIGPAPGLTDPDDCPEPPVVPVTIPGDVWLLGGPKRHRILCGDSTKLAEVERLMGGERADLCFIDQPYNVGYEGYTKDNLTMEGDRMSPDQFRIFLRDSFVCFMATMNPGASLAVCHSPPCH